MPRETEGLPLFDWADENKRRLENEERLKAMEEDRRDLAPGAGSWGTESAGPFKKTEERITPTAPKKPREPYQSEIRDAERRALQKRMRADNDAHAARHGLERTVKYDDVEEEDKK